ncbi:uncharacterized protein LOC130824890 [Amaranthus tricolor]|uniref:uncharacterized protein LOC130824890 n=1 Tax=Amaranthus tricolor TaxID=29722 RepID=UPI00258BB89B|nr:uncharacterized protein LOC130824890 [Amaranthus tricolor]
MPSPNMKYFEKSEISIRPYKLSDVDDFMQWACDSQVLKYSLLQFQISPNSSKEHVIKYFQDNVLSHPYYKAICLHNRAIGSVVLDRQPGKFGLDKGRAQLSYALGSQYWGHGITTTAVRKTVLAAFKELHNLVRIQAFVEIPNKGSEKVLQKVGFVKEGVLRNYAMIVDGEGMDLNVYSILPSDIFLSDGS